MANLLLSASLVLLALHCLALVWLWQIRQAMRTPANVTRIAPHAEAAGPEEIPTTHREAEQWFVSDAEQAERERELIRGSHARAAHVRWNRQP